MLRSAFVNEVLEGFPRQRLHAAHDRDDIPGRRSPTALVDLAWLDADWSQRMAMPPVNKTVHSDATSGFKLILNHLTSPGSSASHVPAYGSNRFFQLRHVV